MEINSDQLIENALRDAFREGVKALLSRGHINPLEKLITTGLDKFTPKLAALLDEGIASCVNDAEFRESIKSSIRQSLAKTLVARFGGELEKQVNALKSDPTTRARITLAIDEIVKSKTTA